LYAYAFRSFRFQRLYDIAIGLGRLLGIKLPENFNSPYLKPNLTQFWNNWHMTLTQWFRAYFFNPVTRALRSGNKPLPIPWIIFITQLATMVLIGLYGVTWNFVWGWHGQRPYLIAGRMDKHFEIWARVPGHEIILFSSLGHGWAFVT
jgi:D-alanyl-lipoteichoic acid acyltransferase DltB (MBOAT superfamily)